MAPVERRSLVISNMKKYSHEAVETKSTTSDSYLISTMFSLGRGCLWRIGERGAQEVARLAIWAKDNRVGQRSGARGQRPHMGQTTHKAVAGLIVPAADAGS